MNCSLFEGKRSRAAISKTCPSSEASIATSPDPSEVGNERAQKVVASPRLGEVGSEPAEKVAATADIKEMEEEEEEYPNIYFK